MLNKKIKYVDFNGIEREENFMFNLTAAELTEMELSAEGGLSEKVNRIIEAKKTTEIIPIFKDIILRSYGVKSDDGRRFIKNQTLRDEFEQTEAYSVLFMELSRDASASSDFVNSIVPKTPK